MIGVAKSDRNVLSVEAAALPVVEGLGSRALMCRGPRGRRTPSIGAAVRESASQPVRAPPEHPDDRSNPANAAAPSR
jgi:hypothetical protein